MKSVIMSQRYATNQIVEGTKRPYVNEVKTVKEPIYNMEVEQSFKQTISSCVENRILAVVCPDRK